MTDPTPPPVPAELPHVVLIGPRGAGKSTTAPAIAARLSRRFLDLDTSIVTAAGGMDIHTIFASEGGEARFRELEAQALSRILGGDERVVLATGGGIVDSATNRALLRERAIVVYLEAELDTQLARVPGPDSTRPRLMPELDWRGEIAQLAARRAPLYRETAHIVIRTDCKDAEGCVADCEPDELAAAFQSRVAAGGWLTSRATSADVASPPTESGKDGKGARNTTGEKDASGSQHALEQRL